MSEKSTVEILADLRPLMRSGKYKLNLKQTIHQGGSEKDSFIRSQILSVNGARHVLGPDAVQAVFPPDGANGSFSDVLPHVVLSDASLPWQRTCETAPGDNARPWLAVLIFKAQVAPAPRRVNESALTDPNQKAQHKGPQPTLPPEISASPKAEDPLVTVIDLPVEVFKSHTPDFTHIHFLSHVRKVKISHKPSVAQVAPPQQYAVVTSSQRPAAPGQWTAHLVSLEGFGDILQNKEKLTSGYVRLATLCSWSFSISAKDDGFLGVLREVSVAAFGCNVKTGAADADAWLSAGYWPLCYVDYDARTRLSWYRGPLMGGDAAATTHSMRATSADALVGLHEASGAFNASHAVAWQLGRLLALRQTSYAESIYRLKHELFRVIIEAQERAGAFANLFAAAQNPVGANARGEGLGGGMAVDAAPSPEPASLQSRDGKDVTALAKAVKIFGERKLAAGASADAPDLREDEKTVAERLGRWSLLESVPLQYLIPDPALLPNEAVRFFKIDKGWITALFDGALSLGEEPDREFGQSVREELARLATRGLSVVRSGFDADFKFDASRPPSAAQLPDVTGFMLRSRAVAGWPGLEITGYGRKQGASQSGTELTILRLERFPPDILFCAFDGTLTHVDLAEPAEGLYFAVGGAAAADASQAVDLNSYVASGVAADAAAIAFADKTMRLGNKIRFTIND